MIFNIFKNKFLKILLCLLIVLLLIFIYLTVKIYKQSNIDNAQKADAIVVLGASQWNGRPSPIFRNRLNHSFLLYDSGLAPKIILTGGVGKSEEISESQVGRDYLTQKGVDTKNIFIEEIGHTTLESLNQVKLILEEQNLSSIILVSDGFHMMRLKKMAADLKIQAFVSPSPEIYTNKKTKFKYVVRESWVYMLYLLFKI